MAILGILNKSFAISLVWLHACFFVLFASGCGSMSSKEDSDELLLASQMETPPFSSTNIGLLKEDKNNSKSPFISIPKEIKLNKNNGKFFLGNPVLKSQFWAVEGWKNMKRGAVDGAKWGFELGIYTCAVPATLTAVSFFVLSGVINS